MKRLTLSCLMVIGILISAFSQTSYPKKILWGSDTVVAITKPQLVTINTALNNYIHLRKINENLRMDIAASDSISSYWRQAAIKMDSISLVEQKKFSEAIRAKEYAEQSFQREKLRSRKFNIGVGVGGTLLGLILGALLIK